MYTAAFVIETTTREFKENKGKQKRQSNFSMNKLNIRLREIYDDVVVFVIRLNLNWNFI